MQAARLSKADEYHLKQRNKIEILFSLLKEKYTLVSLYRILCKFHFL